MLSKNVFKFQLKLVVFKKYLMIDTTAAADSSWGGLTAKLGWM